MVFFVSSIRPFRSSRARGVAIAESLPDRAAFKPL